MRLLRIDSPQSFWTENPAYRDKTDEELIALSSSDREAFGELANRYRTLAFRAAFSVLRNAGDAEDRVQSAFCKAFEHIGQFAQKSKFSTWLVRIVINECLMQLRHGRAATIVSLETYRPESAVFSMADRGQLPGAELESEWLTRILDREIRRIPPLLRNAFLLRDVEQRSIAEVAEQLGVSVQAAKSRLGRAREELRKRLEPYVLQHYQPTTPSRAAAGSPFVRQEKVI